MVGVWYVPRFEQAVDGAEEVSDAACGSGVLAATLLTGLGAQSVAAQETAYLQITKAATQKTYEPADP